jgi:uncharacterized membrane protein YbhN (UPF0104 family)
MQKRFRNLIGPLFGLTLVAIAIIVLAEKLSVLNWSEVRMQFLRLSWLRLGTALLLTGIYYTLITGYDVLAFRVIRHSLPYRRIALASFSGFAFSHNVGLTTLSSGSVRYRIYSSFGLTAKEIAKIVAFATLSFWIGLLAATSAVFLLIPMRPHHLLHLPFATVRPIGWIALVCLLAYVWIVTRGLHGRKIFSLELPHLRLKYVFFQILVGAGDLLLGCLTVYILLPHSQVMGFPRFFEIFLLAYVAGLFSQVPGGIGVFEGVLILLLPKVSSPATIVGALVVFRGIFYIIPLLISIVLLATHEVRLSRGRVKAHVHGR